MWSPLWQLWCNTGLHQWAVWFNIENDSSSLTVPLSVCGSVWGGAAPSEAVLVHLLAWPEDPRQSPTPSGAGTGSGTSQRGSPALQWPNHCPLQVNAFKSEAFSMNVSVTERMKRLTERRSEKISFLQTLQPKIKKTRKKRCWASTSHRLATLLKIF